MKTFVFMGCDFICIIFSSMEKVRWTPVEMNGAAR
jgi:hypothetical protein